MDIVGLLHMHFAVAGGGGGRSMYNLNWIITIVDPKT